MKIKILNEVFNVEKEKTDLEEHIIISHDKWSLIGSGRSFTEAFCSFGINVEEILDNYSDVSEYDMSNECKRMIMFTKEFVYHNKTGVMYIGEIDK